MRHGDERFDCEDPSDPRPSCSKLHKLGIGGHSLAGSDLEQQWARHQGRNHGSLLDAHDEIGQNSSHCSENGHDACQNLLPVSFLGF